MLGGLRNTNGYKTAILFQVCRYELIQSITITRSSMNSMSSFRLAGIFLPSQLVVCLPIRFQSKLGGVSGVFSIFYGFYPYPCACYVNSKICFSAVMSFAARTRFAQFESAGASALYIPSLLVWIQVTRRDARYRRMINKGVLNKPSLTGLFCEVCGFRLV